MYWQRQIVYTSVGQWKLLWAGEFDKTTSLVGYWPKR